MSTDEKWYDFRYRFMETGWFDHDRDKTIEAMRKVCEQVPEDVIDNLPEFVIFAPSASLLGHVLPYGTGRDCLFLYLAPQLENRSQEEVDFTVAHEFGHVALGHYKPECTANVVGDSVRLHEDVFSEKEADSWAESWGFRRP